MAKGKSGGGKLSAVKRNNIKQTKVNKQKKGKVKCDGSTLPKSPSTPSGKKQKYDKYARNDIGFYGNSDEDDVKGDHLLEDEDLEFFESVDTDLSFLSNIDTSESPASRRSQKRKFQDDSDVEEEFEQIPRTSFTNDSSKKFKALLPIKHKKGIELQWGERDIQHEEVEVEGNNNEEKVVETVEPLTPVSTVELFARRQQKILERKQQIASLASMIVEDPENSTKQLKDLRILLDESDPDVVVTVRKLVMVSLVEVFQDIVPSYRIRELSETEQNKQVSKDVKRVRDFEQNLLKNYRLYLEKLERALRGYKKRERSKKKGQGNESLPPKALQGLKEVAARCMCTLMTTLTHFNYRSNIISVIVPYTLDKNQLVSDLCCSSVRQLFKEDPLGEASLDAVKVITRIVKAKNCNVKSKVLDTFLSLKIKDVDLNVDAGEDKKSKLMAKKEKIKKMSRQERRRSKRADKLEKELLETAASENKKRKQYLQTEIIKMVFAIYFRILKRAETSSLLPSVLEGLAKFAHLINVEFFDDLVKVLHELIQSGDLSRRESLHCILTAFHILSGQGQVLNIDPLKFYSHLYKMLFELHLGMTTKDVPIALKCLDVMINKRRKQVTLQRVLAFTKRLCVLALHVFPNAALGLLAAVRSFLQMHTKCDVLLDNDSTGSGVYLAELQEPEHCNAHNTTLWELYLLKRHYHPYVQKYSSHLCKGAPIQGIGSLSPELVRKSPSVLYEIYDPLQMAFNPPIQPPVKQQRKKFSAPERPFLQRTIQAEIDKAIVGMPEEKLAKMDFSACLPYMKTLNKKQTIERVKRIKSKKTKVLPKKPSKIIKTRRKKQKV
ncbi:nucleolar complex protein 3 homolog [Saccoglossus kowalevskii]|uniref:Nucleolar complex protein 3 homolog n=1 Tax=Saccoglossus kowalevskii TaxID=10224 RepID=A0ABM0N0D9_SACKO|nr:PREDICTED: nucleolar complex protein 3 homolog [Saccoglossus kowalevskii]